MFLNQRAVLRVLWLKRRTELCACSHVFSFNSKSLSTKESHHISIPTKCDIELENVELKDLVNSLSARRKKNFEKFAQFVSTKPALQDGKIKDKLFYYIATNRCQTVPSSLYLIDPDIAKDIYEKIRPFLIKYKGHVLEANAGPGVLTEILMKSKIKNLRIYEADPAFLGELQALNKTHKNKAKLFDFNLLRLQWMMNRDKEDNIGRFNSAFQGIETQPWEGDPVLKMFMVLPHEYFLTCQMYDFLMQSGISNIGRPEFFFVIPSANYEILTCEKPFNSRSLRKFKLFNIVFEHKVLMRVPETAIFPWRYKRKHDIKKASSEEHDLVLAHVIPRSNLLQVIGPERSKSFVFFMKTVFHKPSAPIVAVLEKWVPGFGLKLLSQEFTIYTACKSLTTEQIIRIFNLFMDQPQDKLESFLAVSEHHLMKSISSQEMLMEIEKKEKQSSLSENVESESVENPDVESELEDEENPNDNDEDENR